MKCIFTIKQLMTAADIQ